MNEDPNPGPARSLRALAMTRRHVLRTIGLAVLLASLWPGIASVHAQDSAPAAHVLFDAVTLDDSRVALTRAQSRQVASIARLAGQGRDDAALKEWQLFVTRHYRRNPKLDLDAIELMIVRDGFFHDRELREIGKRYRLSTGAYLSPKNPDLSVDSEVPATGRSRTGIDLDTMGRNGDRLRKDKTATNAGQEQTMMKLQAAMQTRAQTVQSGSNFLAAIHNSTRTIVGNLR